MHLYFNFYTITCILLFLFKTTAITEAVSSSSDYYDNDDDDIVTMTNTLFTLEPCPERCKDIDDSSLRRKNNSNNNNNNTVRIFYLILVHNVRTANDAIYLFRSIRNMNNIIVFHYDSKVKELIYDNNNNPLQQEINNCPCGSKVIIESIHTVEWSKWSMNLPTLWGMELAVNDKYINEWDIYINLSGDTIPIYTTETMNDILYNLPKYNYVTSKSCETGLIPTNVYIFPKFWHKRKHYTRDETEIDPYFQYYDNENNHNIKRNITLTIHFGSQWVILQKDFIVWLIKQLNDKHSWPSQFRDYLIASNKLMTDETFIPTIIMYYKNGTTIPPDNDTLYYTNGTNSYITDIRYERMDEHYPTAFGIFPNKQRYQVPNELLNILDQPRIWGPYFLGIYDLSDIRTSGALFARKVSALIDINLVQLLPVNHKNQIPNISWPKTSSISLIDKPNWNKEKKLWNEMLQRQRQKQQSQDDEDEEL